VKLWLQDMQYVPNIAIGAATTTLPTVYGFVSNYGIDATIFAKAFATSSGAGTDVVLTMYPITP